MRAAAKIRRIGATAAILTWPFLAAATSALAQTSSGADASGAAASPGRDVVNGQVQLGDVFASQTIDVVDADQTVNQATAVANTASAALTATGGSFTSTQTASGAVGATVFTTVTGSSGDYAGGASSATGNTGTAAATGGRLSGSAVQAAGPGAITAETSLSVADPSGQLSADSTAIGNTQGWSVSQGALAQSTTQTLSAPVSAVTTVTAGEIADEAGATATAVGNDVGLQGTASTVEGVTQQTITGGSVYATLTSQQQAGDQIAGQATATGNNVTVAGDGGYTTNDHTQSNAAAVTADAAYGIGVWNSASVGAYGVGNSVYVSAATSPNTEIGVEQSNTGAVTAKSSLLTGGAGGDAYVNATAVGNAIQGYACATCSGGVGANATQSNGGAVNAQGVYRGAYGGSVTGAASAIGNTATYVVRGSGS